MSPTSPFTRPLLVIHLDKICGSTSFGQNEFETIKNHIVNSIFGSNASIDSDSDSESTHVISVTGEICSSFIDNTCALFEMGFASHSEVTGQDYSGAIVLHKPDRLVFDYPDFFPIQEDARSLINTTDAWRQIIQGHDIAVVQRILSLLSKCSRDLMWKCKMSTELRNLADREEQKRIEQFQRKELRHWKTKHRPAYLEKLYQVRDTFDMRVDLMRKRHTELVNDREARVQRELQQRRGDSGGLSSIDWDWKLHFKDDESNDENVEDSVTPPGSQNEPKSYSDQGEHDWKENFDSDWLGRLEGAQRKEKEKEEEDVRLHFTTKDEKMCLTTLCNLEKRLDDIDQLLESLQEEQWIDEEEGFDHEEDSHEGDEEYQDPSEANLSIIDQILAMILGSLPQADGKTEQEHYEHMRNEHESIVHQWKDHFGSLPFLLSPTEEELSTDLTNETEGNLRAASASDPAMQRLTLGIIENEFIDWEDVEDWKDVA